MQPDGSNLWYFKPRLFDLTKFIVGNMKGLRIEKLSLWQKLISLRIEAISMHIILHNQDVRKKGLDKI